MTQPRTIEGRQHTSFVESPSRENNSAREVVIGNTAPIDVNVVGGFDDNVEQGFANGDVSAVKAVYDTGSGLSLANNNVDFQQAYVIGISRTSATDGNDLQYKIIGKFQDSSLSFAIGSQIYLDVNGGLTDVAPTTGFRVAIGVAINSGIQINIEEPIIL